MSIDILFRVFTKVILSIFDGFFIGLFLLFMIRGRKFFR
jgi:hypothetical protein